MSVFVLKIIAAFFMVVDHVKYAFPLYRNEFTIYLGRIAFPIFSFCIVQGYIHTRDLKRYMKRLLFAGFISEIPFLLFNSLPTLQHIGLDVMFTFFLGVLAIRGYEFYENRAKKILAVIVVAICAELLRVDYGVFGVFLVFSFYIFRDSKFKTLLASLLVVCAKYMYRLFILGASRDYTIKNWICTSIPLFIILLYNRKKGPGMKWLFYIFYPLHFLVLYVLSPYTIYIN